MRFAGKHPDRTTALILAGGEANLEPDAKRMLTERAQTIESHGLIAVADAWLHGSGSFDC